MPSGLDDPSPDVRIVAAQAIAQYGHDEDRPKALSVLLGLSDVSRNDVFVTLAASARWTRSGPGPRPSRRPSAPLREGDVPDPRYASYVPRLLQDIQARLKSPGATDREGPTGQTRHP